MRPLSWPVRFPAHREAEARPLSRQGRRAFVVERIQPVQRLRNGPPSRLLAGNKQVLLALLPAGIHDPSGENQPVPGQPEAREVLVFAGGHGRRQSVHVAFLWMSEGLTHEGCIGQRLPNAGGVRSFQHTGDGAHGVHGLYHPLRVQRMARGLGPTEMVADPTGTVALEDMGMAVPGFLESALLEPKRSEHPLGLGKLRVEIQRLYQFRFEFHFERSAVRSRGQRRLGRLHRLPVRLGRLLALGVEPGRLSPHHEGGHAEEERDPPVHRGLSHRFVHLSHPKRQDGANRTSEANLHPCGSDSLATPTDTWTIASFIIWRNATKSGMPATSAV